MFGYINVNGAQLSEENKKYISRIIVALPEIKRVLWKKRTGTFEL